MRLLAPALLALLLAGCGGGSGQSTGPAEPLATYVTVRSDLDIVVSEGGSLKSAKPVLVMVKESGKVLTAVKNGAQVAKGDLLIQLENEQLADELKRNRAELENAESTLEASQAALKLNQLERSKTEADAARDLRFAQLALAMYRDGKAPLEERSLDLAARRAELEKTDAAEKAARMPELLEKAFINPSEARQATLDAEAKTQEALTKRRELELFQQFSRPQELAKMEAEVAAAMIGQERVKQQIATESNAKQSEVRLNQTRVDNAKEAIARCERNTANLKIIAPADGMVVYGDPQRGYYYGQDDLPEPGRDVNANQVILSLPDLTDMVAEVAINEVNISRVIPNMEATVVVDGLGGRSFKGRVDHIAATSQREWGADAKRYLATIALLEAGGTTFRSDMTCHAEIRIAHLPGVLHVPVDAVVVRDGKSWCWVREGSAWIRRAVTLGQASESQVEVKDGLKEGEAVAIFAVEPGVGN